LLLCGISSGQCCRWAIGIFNRAVCHSTHT
jgi:hypothetical protein